jgi:hypothetical protein
MHAAHVAAIGVALAAASSSVPMTSCCGCSQLAFDSYKKKTNTFIFCFCIAISVLLAWLGYRRFCARPKSTSRPAATSRSMRPKSTSRPAATSRSIPLRSRFSTLEDKIEMEDFDEAVTYGFTTQRHGLQPNFASAPRSPRYAQKQTCYGPAAATFRQPV